MGGQSRDPNLGLGQVILLDGLCTPAGDVNGDGVVDVADLVAVILAWGPCPPREPCPADTNDDGVVDVSDLIQVILDWG